MAKRIRDIGLPGWWSLLAIIGLEYTISFLVSESAGSALHLLVWAALLLIPRDAFPRSKRS